MARARLTASFTQSWIGASFTWHIRQISPFSTLCSKRVAPVSSTTRTVPGAGSSKVLSWEPYSSAFCAISPTLGTVPMVVGVEGAVLFAVFDHGLIHPGVAIVRNHGLGVLLLAGLVPHLARGSDHRRHGGINDDVAGYV